MQNQRSRGTLLEYELVPPSGAEKRLATISGSGAIVLVSMSEPALSSKPNGETEQRVACPSFSLAQTLAARSNELAIFLLRHSDQPPLVAVDVIAAMMAGVAGVLDDRVLPCDGLLPLLFDHHPITTRTRSMLVVGRSVDKLREVKTMLETWDQNLSGDGTMDQACWRAAIALAQLDRLLPLPSSGDRYSFVRLAQTLNLRSATTAFRLTESDLRKVLSMLADCWRVPTGDERADRVRLPQYARDHGFPWNPPVVQGFSDGQLPRRLYDAARAMELLERDRLGGELSRVIVRVPNRLFKRLHKGDRS